MKHLRLYESFEDRSLALERAESLPRLLDVYRRYRQAGDPGITESYTELAYFIWSWANPDLAKNIGLVEPPPGEIPIADIIDLFSAGLSSWADVTLAHLRALPGIDRIVCVFDNTRDGAMTSSQTETVKLLFPGLIVKDQHTPYHAEGRLNWQIIQEPTPLLLGEGSVGPHGQTKHNKGLALIQGSVEGPSGKTPILTVNEFYVEAWMDLDKM